MGSDESAQRDRLTHDRLLTPRPSAGPNVPAQLERAITARWKQWAPWLRMQQLWAGDYDPSVASAESARLRLRRSEHILDLMREGISMRTIRRHRLDDPSITDEVRTVLVDAGKSRQSKAWFRRTEDQRAVDSLTTAIRLGPVVRNAAAANETNESAEVQTPAAAVVLNPPALRQAIQRIRRLVCDHFYLREMRDPELTVRTNRRSYVLPRQLAMYITRQLTGASLQDIGCEFGGRHHSTVLHAISKIEATRRTDEALTRTITKLMDAVVAQT